MTDAERAAASESQVAIGMLESILQKVQADMASDATKTWGTVGELKHLTEQLQEIEDRLYQQGEYARN